MLMKVRAVVASLAAAAAYAQTQAPAPPVQPEVLQPGTYVRRVSIGASLSVMGLLAVPKGDANVVTAGPAIDSLYSTTDASKRVGFGATAQVAVTERFAVSASVLIRKVGFKKNSDIFKGADNPLTIADERTYMVQNEDTRARFMDIPVTVRYYFKDRHTSGPRGFVEGGAAIRRVSHVSTAIDTTINDGALTCCDNTPAPVARRTVRGLVAGAGLQFIDPVGVRVVPQIRYTRWTGLPFDSPSVSIQRNQIEAVISLTF
jgi:hypothetical protein